MVDRKLDLKIKGSDVGMNFYWKEFPASRLLVEASLWSADFTRFAEEIERVDPYVDMYHIDVSDGDFVPGFLFFEDLVAALRPLSKRPFHVHLMTKNPLNHIDAFVKAGADIITVHAENGTLTPAALNAARLAGVATGLAVGLYVQLDTIEPYLEDLDLVLVMGTPMGVKGVQPSNFFYERTQKIKKMIHKSNLDDQVKIFVDGGIRKNTVPELYASGADGIIAGSLVFKSENLDETFSWLQGLKSGSGADK